MPAAGDDGADPYGKSTAVGSILTRESIPETHKPPSLAADYTIPDAHVNVAHAHDVPPSRVDTRSSLVNVKEGLYAIRPTMYEPIGEAQPTPRCEAKIFNWDRLDGKGHSRSQIPAGDKFDGKGIRLAVKLSVLEAELVARETKITGKNSRIRELEEQLGQSKRQAGSSAASFTITEGSQADRTDESRPAICGTLHVPTRPS